MTKIHYMIAALALVCCSYVGAADEAAVSAAQSPQPIAKVYFTRDLSPEGLLKVYNKVNADITGKVAIKWHSGEGPPEQYPQQYARGNQYALPR